MKSFGKQRLKMDQRFSFPVLITRNLAGRMSGASLARTPPTMVPAHNVSSISFFFTGWLYLTVNHLAFYSFILGTETKILLRWTDVVEIETLPAALLQGNSNGRSLI
jgi:hypothetical protein